MSVELDGFCGGIEAGGTLGSAGEGGVKGVEEDLLAGFSKEIKAVSAIVVGCQSDVQLNNIWIIHAGGSTGKVLGAQPAPVMPVGYWRLPADSQEKDVSTLSESTDITFGMLHVGVSS